MSASEKADFDQQVGLYAFQVWNYKQGETVALMIHLGDRLGLYRAMSGAGPITSEELARRTGLHPRWLLEWLRSQAAARMLLSVDGTTFELPAAAEPVLVDETSSLWFAAGAFQGGAAPPDVVERLAEAFRTGTGLTYDQLGPTAAHSIERMLGPWSRLALVQVVLPALDGVVPRLHAGATVADVGCGAGVALLAMAQAFPTSHFEGFDPSQHAIHRARSRAAELDVSNATFHLAEAADLPTTATYDVVLTLDCLHDMPHPAEAMAAIGRSLKKDGVWLIKEIRAGETWQDNLANPMLAMM